MAIQMQQWQKQMDVGTETVYCLFRRSNGPNLHIFTPFIEQSAGEGQPEEMKEKEQMIPQNRMRVFVNFSYL
jgi:hypothetical protein